MSLLTLFLHGLRFCSRVFHARILASASVVIFLPHDLIGEGGLESIAARDETALLIRAGSAMFGIGRAKRSAAAENFSCIIRVARADHQDEISTSTMEPTNTNNAASERRRRDTALHRPPLENQHLAKYLSARRGNEGNHRHPIKGRTSTRAGNCPSKWRPKVFVIGRSGFPRSPSRKELSDRLPRVVLPRPCRH